MGSYVAVGLDADVVVVVVIVTSLSDAVLVVVIVTSLSDLVPVTVGLVASDTDTVVVEPLVGTVIVVAEPVAVEPALLALTLLRSTVEEAWSAQLTVTVKEETGPVTV